MNDKQYKLARTAAYVFNLGQDDGHKDLDKFLDIAAQVVKDAGSYKQCATADGKGGYASSDIERLKALLQKHNRTPEANETGEVTAVQKPPIHFAKPWVRCSGWTPAHQPGLPCNKGYAEFKAMEYSQFAFNDRYGEKPPSKFCIPVKHDKPQPGEPYGYYDSDILIENGDAEPAANEDGSPVKWVKLTAQFFEKHGFEFTTDGQQIKPKLAVIKQWLRQHINPELMRNGVVMGRDNSGASDSVSDELVRVGIAEAYSETQIQITPEEFRALGLLGVVEAAEPTPL